MSLLCRSRHNRHHHHHCRLSLSPLCRCLRRYCHCHHRCLAVVIVEFTPHLPARNSSDHRIVVVSKTEFNVGLGRGIRLGGQVGLGRVLLGWAGLGHVRSGRVRSGIQPQVGCCIKRAVAVAAAVAVTVAARSHQCRLCRQLWLWPYRLRRWWVYPS